MSMHREIHSIVVMGVSGSGKTTIGQLLAEAINSRFSDGDKLHSTENIAIMSAGKALSDSDRLPWLRSVGELLQGAHGQGESAVVACSALKRSYRDVLRTFVPDILFIFLDGPAEVVQERILLRSHEFMPPSLLASQFANLEPLEMDERGMRVDITLAPEEIVNQIVGELKKLPTHTKLK